MPEKTTRTGDEPVVTDVPVDYTETVIVEDAGQKRLTFKRADVALDELMAARQKDSEGSESAESAKKAADEKAAAEKAAAEKAAAEKAALAAEADKTGDGAAAAGPAAPGEAQGATGAQATAGVEQPVAVVPSPVSDLVVDPEFLKKVEEVKLPPHSRPASAEAFATVKEMGRQEVERISKRARALADEVAAVKKSAEEAAAKAAQVPPEILKEVEELRNFRAALDVDNAPPVKVVTEKIAANEGRVFSLLRENGMSEDGIKQIKEELGGVAKVDWSSVLAKLDATAADDLKALVSEARILGRDHTEVAKKARANASEFVKLREQDEVKRQQAVAQSRVVAADALLAKIDHAREIDVAKVSEAERPVVAVRNVAAKKLRERVAAALSDTSPDMHATLAVGSALAFVYAEQNDGLNKRLSTIAAEHKAALDAMQKERDVAVAQLERIRKASRGSRVDDPNRVSRKLAPAGGEYKFGVRASTALDQLAAEVAAERDSA